MWNITTADLRAVRCWWWLGQNNRKWFTVSAFKLHDVIQYVINLMFYPYCVISLLYCGVLSGQTELDKLVRNINTCWWNTCRFDHGEEFCVDLGPIRMIPLIFPFLIKVISELGFHTGPKIQQDWTQRWYGKSVINLITFNVRVTWDLRWF